MSAFAGLLRKEWLHILRDRRTLFVVIFMPILQVVLFGYAIRTDISAVRLAIVDPSPDASTLELRNRFAATDVFRLVRLLPSTGTLDQLFASGDIQEAVVFDPDFANRLARGLPARVLVIVDASEPNTGSAMESYALGVIQRYERELATRGASVQITAEARMRFNPTRASSNLFVPGLIAFVLTIISALMTAISLTREKETGTMEILLVSPLRPLEIIVGKVLAYVVIGFVSVLLVVAEARLIFAVPLRGSLLLLLAEGVLYILTSLSLGILISSRTSSQRVAMIGALAGTMLPTILLSGFIFPIESMPWPLRLISNIVPAKWFVLIARGVMLKGVGLEYLWQETLILLGMTLLLVAAATRSFRIRLA
ncbi:MAG TPA: ABC transporter permease [Gemmatimonadaceae bacterium]|nr:ABC transporter permease [Gemmatimonadaceae bacterium]